jgi:integrase
VAYPERREGPRGPYYRARYRRPDGQLDCVKDADGNVIRFGNRRKAAKAARDTERDEEARAEQGKWVARELGRTTLSEYVHGRGGAGWLDAQDLAESTEQSYRHYLKHILPVFGDVALADIDGKAIDAWEKRERATGAASSATTYRKILHLILEDAVDEGLITVNPAKRRRGRGKRAGRSTTRGPEKRITDTLGILMLAERAALLAGRDDEFIACVLTGYTGMRWGEVVGLEPRFVRDRTVRIESQLYELDDGSLTRCPPKDDSYRTIDAPAWLTALLTKHAGARGKPCACHDLPFVFRGRRTGQKGARTGPTLAEVAREAGVSTGTVSNVLNHPGRVREATRVRVEKVIADLGFVRGGIATSNAAHWRRSGFATWIFTPAATGWYPAKSPQPRHPVPVTAEPFPGIPARGRGATARATASWTPVQEGLTRHGLRHTHRTVMEQLGTPKVLMDERMGHMDGSVSARYAHVTDSMRLRLVDDLTGLWQAALDARIAIHPRSPVAALDALLRERAAVTTG